MVGVEDRTTLQVDNIKKLKRIEIFLGEEIVVYTMEQLLSLFGENRYECADTLLLPEGIRLFYYYGEDLNTKQKGEGYNTEVDILIEAGYDPNKFWRLMYVTRDALSGEGLIVTLDAETTFEDVSMRVYNPFYIVANPEEDFWDDV